MVFRARVRTAWSSQAPEGLRYGSFRVMSFPLSKPGGSPARPNPGVRLIALGRASALLATLKEVRGTADNCNMDLVGSGLIVVVVGIGIGLLNGQEVDSTSGHHASVSTGSCRKGPSKIQGHCRHVRN